MQDFLLTLKSKIDKIKDPIESQMFLENYWMTKMKEFLDNEKNLVQRHGNNVNIQLYQNINESINIVESNNKLKNQRFHDKVFKKYNHEKYNFLGNLLDYKECYMLAYLIGVDCVMKEMSHTSTILKIGNTILTNLFLRDRKLYIEENNIKILQISNEDRYYSIDNFLSSYNITNEDILFVGDQFLNLFLGYPIPVFEKTFDVKRGFY